MSSIIDICNRALSELGTQSLITSFDELSNEAAQCRLWYDNLRRGLIRAAPWGFTRRQVVLTQLGTLADSTSPYPFLYKYAYPSDALKIRYLLWQPAVLPATVVPNVGQPLDYGYLRPSRQSRYMVAADVDLEGNDVKVLLTNVSSAIAVYTANIQTPDMFDDLFEDALTAALSYKLCVPLTGNVGMRDQYSKAADVLVLQARAVDANEAIPSTDHTTDWIATRGAGASWGYGLGPNPQWGNWTDGYDNMNWGM